MFKIKQDKSTTSQVNTPLNCQNWNISNDTWIILNYIMESLNVYHQDTNSPLSLPPQLKKYMKPWRNIMQTRQHPIPRLNPLSTIILEVHFNTRMEQISVNTSTKTLVKSINPDPIKDQKPNQFHIWKKTVLDVDSTTKAW